jgi:hypothetical protein
VAQKAPWHLWVVGSIGLMWNAFGAFNYVMTETHNTAYLSGLTAEQLAYFNSFPAWSVACWALGAVSLIGQVGSNAFQWISDMPESLHTPGAMAFSAAIFAVTLAQFWYARTMQARSVLR